MSALGVILILKLIQEYKYTKLFTKKYIYLCVHNYESGLSQKIKKMVISYFMFHPFKKYSNKMSVLKNRLKLNR